MRHSSQRVGKDSRTGSSRAVVTPRLPPDKQPVGASLQPRRPIWLAVAVLALGLFACIVLPKAVAFAAENRASTNQPPLTRAPAASSTNSPLQDPNFKIPDDPVQLLNFGTELLDRGWIDDAITIYSK